MKAVTDLVGLGADIKQADGDGFTAMDRAEKSNNVEIIKTLLCLVEKSGDTTMTRLRTAAETNKPAVIRAIAEMGTDLNVPLHNDENLPIHIAAEYGSVDAVQALAEKGADVNSKDVHGQTPIRVAAYMGDLNVMKVLVECRADINLVDKRKISPLLHTVRTGNTAVSAMFVNMGADLKQCLRHERFAYEGAADVARSMQEMVSDFCDRVGLPIQHLLCFL